jgi:hypothetical protein
MPAEDAFYLLTGVRIPALVFLSKSPNALFLSL